MRARPSSQSLPVPSAGGSHHEFGIYKGGWGASRGVITADHHMSVLLSAYGPLKGRRPPANKLKTLLCDPYPPAGRTVLINNLKEG